MDDRGWFLKVSCKRCAKGIFAPICTTVILAYLQVSWGKKFLWLKRQWKRTLDLNMP